MAQVYSFVDENGVTRLFAEIHPDPAGTSFNGGTITNDLTINRSTTGGLTITRGSLAGAVFQASVVDEGAGVETAELTLAGLGGGGGDVIRVANGSAAGTQSSIDGEGALNLFTASTRKGIEAWDDAGNTLRFALLEAGQPMIGVTAAPADAALSANQVALWFDSTNGASKLMVKGKSANGTVVAASIALA